MRVGTLAMEERTSEFLLQLPDRSCQGGLSHMAALSRMSEVQVLAQGQEIPHLMHFHNRPPEWLPWINLKRSPSSGRALCFITTVMENAIVTAGRPDVIDCLFFG